MVYCTKCGTKNEEDAAVCIKCGASLAPRPAWRPERKRAEEECFGLPHGGAIVGIVFEAIVILAGLIFVLQEMGVIREAWDLIWPLIVIIFGILIVAGALYSYSRRS